MTLMRLVSVGQNLPISTVFGLPMSLTSEDCEPEQLISYRINPYFCPPTLENSLRDWDIEVLSRSNR